MSRTKTGEKKCCRWYQRVPRVSVACEKHTLDISTYSECGAKLHGDDTTRTKLLAAFSNFFRKLSMYHPRHIFQIIALLRCDRDDRSEHLPDITNVTPRRSSRLLSLHPGTIRSFLSNSFKNSTNSLRPDDAQHGFDSSGQRSPISPRRCLSSVYSSSGGGAVTPIRKHLLDVNHNVQFKSSLSNSTPYSSAPKAAPRRGTAVEIAREGLSFGLVPTVFAVPTVAKRR